MNFKPSWSQIWIPEILKLLQQLDFFFPTYQLYVVLSCKLYHHARPQNVTRYQEMNLSDLLILLSIIEFSSHIFAKLQLCIGYRITSTHSCAEDFTLEPGIFCSRFYTVCKGQLISECPFEILDFPKIPPKIWQISALESKKWSNHKIKALSDNIYDQICYLMY